MNYLSIKLRLITAPASWVIIKSERIGPVLGTFIDDILLKELSYLNPFT